MAAILSQPQYGYWPDYPDWPTQVKMIAAVVLAPYKATSNYMNPGYFTLAAINLKL